MNRKDFMLQQIAVSESASQVMITGRKPVHTTWASALACVVRPDDLEVWGGGVACQRINPNLTA